MSATEDDTELRDLLIQNLENSGVLNKLKAEMRAAVFLAMEEQDRLENKTPLINENLKKSLNTKDGRLGASLILDFLQVFNLDFTLAVFQPEISSLWCLQLNGLDSRDLVCRELDLSESEVNRNSPLLLELVRRRRHKPTEGDGSVYISKEPSQKQIAHARKKFDFYDKDGSGSVATEDLKSVFTDLIPGLNRNMLERFVADELRAADRSFSKTTDFQVFLGLYKRLFAQCTSVVVQDSDVGPAQSHFPEEKTSSPPASKIPRYKGQNPRGQSQTAAKDSEVATSPSKGDLQLQGSRRSEASDNRASSSGLKRERLDQDLEVEDDLDDGDSFFDDPLPKPQKTYGCSPLGEKDSSERTNSQKEKVEASGARGSPAGSLSEAPRPGGGGGGGGGGRGSSMSEQSHSRNGASSSRERGFRDSKALNDKTGSLHLDDDVEYDDDFNSHRSDLSKSELSIGEEIEEVSIEGPDNSDKFDETTQDLSVSQLSQSHGVDYMEEVA
ncbi:FGFR1 oncogene partner isoform X8 [Siniperca chuatsi]|uniref:FGFR1 oncogene partner isoform X8 n=1 Tax=Siniperca chuatsi TaxID=119488 RepID=UPI001CE15755|nr:FGFR1 oncogene partner isoform X8 [Siniperca chuatsi]